MQTNCFIVDLCNSAFKSSQVMKAEPTSTWPGG